MPESNIFPPRSDADLNELADEAAHAAHRERPEERGKPLRRLALGLANAIPDDDLPTLIAELRAEHARRRDIRFESILADARAAVERGDLNEARQEAEALCRLDGLRWEPHQLLAEILERSGDLRGARARYGTAIHLGWEGPEADRALARLRPEDGHGWRRRR